MDHNETIPSYISHFLSLKDSQPLIRKAKEILTQGKYIRNWLKDQQNEQYDQNSEKRHIYHERKEKLTSKIKQHSYSIESISNEWKNNSFGLNENKIELETFVNLVVDIMNDIKRLQELNREENERTNQFEEYSPYQNQLDDLINTFNQFMNELKDMMKYRASIDDRFQDDDADEDRNKYYYIPWQLSFCKDTNPDADNAVVEFSSGTILDEDGDDIFSESCCVCGNLIQNGSFHGEGDVRYRCMECVGKFSKHVICNVCHLSSMRINHLFQSIQCNLKMLDHKKSKQKQERKEKEKDEEYPEKQLDCLYRLEKDFIRQINPHLKHRMSEEYNLPVLTRLEVLNAPSLPTLVNNLFLCYRNRPCFGTRNYFDHMNLNNNNNNLNYKMKSISDYYYFENYDTIRRLTFALASGMKTLMPRSSNIGISCSSNCAEFFISDFACTLNEWTTIGLYYQKSDDELIYMINLAEISCIICSSDLISIFTCVKFRDQCPQLKYVINLDRNDSDNNDNNNNSQEYFQFEQISIISFHQIMKLHDQHYSTWSGLNINTPISNSESFSNIKPESNRENNCHHFNSNEDLFTISFTSGSTGTPKGVMISRRQWMLDISKSEPCQLTVLCPWLPSEMGADRMLVWQGLFNGFQIGFARRQYHLLLQDVQLLNPTMIFGAPFLWNNFYNQYCEMVKNQFRKRCSLSPKKQKQQEQYEDVESSILQKFSRILGDRIQVIGSGGAAISSKVVTFLKHCFSNVEFIEGYGATECGGISSNGKVSKDVEIHLEDVPELGYFKTDRPFPRGELFVHSNIVACGYFKNESATRESFTDDGWYKTGDIVELDPQQNRIRVIDRKKDIFKLSNSIFICPSKIESILSSSNPSLVSQIFVFGDNSMSQVMSVVVPTDNHVSKSEILKAFNRTRQTEQLNTSQIPKDILLLSPDDKWTIDNGLLTPTAKICRPALRKLYEGKLKMLYENQNTHSEFHSDQLIDSQTETNQLSPKDTDLAPFEYLLENEEKQLETILFEILESTELDRNKSFMENGGDSMKAVQFILKLNSVFEIERNELSIQWILFQPLNQVIQSIIQRNIDSQQDSNIDSLKKQLRYDLIQLIDDMIDTGISIPTIYDQDEKNNGMISNHDVLITGATGFIGIHVLEALLRGFISSNKIYALVRSENNSEAPKRLVEIFKNAYPNLKHEIDDSIHSGKLIPVSGDITQSFNTLGIENERIRSEIINNVGLIYHCAADVSFIKPYSALRTINVVGTRNLILFASRSNSKRSKKILIHISSVSAILNNKLEYLYKTDINNNKSKEEDFSGIIETKDLFLEDEQVDHLLKSVDGYSMSKSVSERFVEAAWHRNLISRHSKIIRPALIGPHSRTRHANRYDWFFRFTEACKLASCLPPRHQDAEAKINILPVNLCSSLIAAVGALQLDKQIKENKESQCKDNQEIETNSSLSLSLSSSPFSSSSSSSSFSAKSIVCHCVANRSTLWSSIYGEIMAQPSSEPVKTCKSHNEWYNKIGENREANQILGPLLSFFLSDLPQEHFSLSNVKMRQLCKDWNDLNYVQTDSPLFIYYE